MDWYKRVQTSVLSWAHGTPLPQGDSHASVNFQSWHYFDPDGQQWAPSRADANSSNGGIQGRDNDAPELLTLLTWNIDATSARTEDRVTEIVTYTSQVHPKVDIIFLQEVSRPALEQILKDERIRRFWFSSECDDGAWGNQSFATMTLLSRQRFVSTSSEATLGKARLGPIWRVSYPSRFGRDALCCDVFAPSLNSPHSLTRMRLINVHLDSLPINPSHRPQQVSIISKFLRSAGRGLAAGDFNPVLEEDATLLERNGLTDAWSALYPEQPGYTWGTDGKQPFPANRLDKVALFGLRPHNIKVVEAKRLNNLEAQPTSQVDTNQPEGQPSEDLENNPPLSDHHALLCSFALVGSN